MQDLLDQEEQVAVLAVPEHHFHSHMVEMVGLEHLLLDLLVVVEAAAGVPEEVEESG